MPKNIGLKQVTKFVIKANTFLADKFMSKKEEKTVTSPENEKPSETAFQITTEEDNSNETKEDHMDETVGSKSSGPTEEQMEKLKQMAEEHMNDSLDKMMPFIKMSDLKDKIPDPEDDMKLTISQVQSIHEKVIEYSGCKEDSK